MMIGDEGGKSVRRIDGSSMRRSVRGQGSNTRYVCDVLMADDPTADHLLVTEVITPGGEGASMEDLSRAIEAELAK